MILPFMVYLVTNNFILDAFFHKKSHISGEIYDYTSATTSTLVTFILTK